MIVAYYVNKVNGKILGGFLNALWDYMVIIIVVLDDSIRKLKNSNSLYWHNN